MLPTYLAHVLVFSLANFDLEFSSTPCLLWHAFAVCLCLLVLCLLCCVLWLFSLDQLQSIKFLLIVDLSAESVIPSTAEIHSLFLQEFLQNQFHDPQASMQSWRQFFNSFSFCNMTLEFVFEMRYDGITGTFLGQEVQWYVWDGRKVILWEINVTSTTILPMQNAQWGELEPASCFHFSGEENE